MRKNNYLFGVLALLVSVVAIGMVYAGFTQTLNINGTGNVVASKWDIYFANLANAVTTGSANVVTPATISPKTKIGDYYVTLSSPGDSVTYTFDVVNGGDFDAVLTTLTKSAPTCSGGATICNYLSYTLKYTSNNSDVAENDTLLVGQTKNMTLKLMLNSNTPSSALPSTEVSVSNLGITLLYSQDSPYGGNPVIAPTYLYSPKQHSLGDTLIVNNTTVFDNFESAKYNSSNYTTAHIVDNSNHIIESYVAFKINDTIYYLKGYDTNAYSDNLDELHRAFPSCNIDRNEDSNGCSSGDWYASARSDGYVGMYLYNSYCIVDPSSGNSICDSDW